MAGGAWVSAGAVADRLGQFRALSRWLGVRGLPVAELDPERVEEFLEARRAAGYRYFVADSSVRLPLEYLMGIGVVPLLQVTTAPSPVERVLEEYRRYLLLERRLAQTTVAGYERVARVFVEHRVRRCAGLELERLSAADVSEFVAFECRRLRRRRAWDGREATAVPGVSARDRADRQAASVGGPEGR